ncbi:hypothetical protein Tco_1528357, partial [Tanacetum coccineum]
MLVPPVVVGEGSEQPHEPQPTSSTAPSEVLSPVTTAATSQPLKDPSTYRRTKRGWNTKVPQSGGSPNKVGDETINEEIFDSVERDATTTTSIEAEQASGNIHKTQFTATLNEPFSLELGSGSGGHTLGSGVNTPGSDEGRLKLEELMDMCTKLSKQRKSSISHPRRRIYKQVEYSDDDLDEEDASKQGRISDKTNLIFKDSDFDDLDDLVDKGMAFVQEKDVENQGKIGVDDIEVVKGSGERKCTAAPRTPPTTTTFFDDEDVTMAMAQTLIKMKEEKAKEKGVAIKDVEDSSRLIRSITTLQPLPTINPKDKCDAQIERDAEVALRLQAKLDEALRVERERQEEASKVVIAEMFDEVQARIDA